MASIRGKDTAAEIKVRKFLHAQGFRFSLHRVGLPGKPDLVLPKWNAVIFVNGCYWHRHENCKYSYFPRSNTEFWALKFEGNVKRDNKNYRLLREGGWKVIVVWECEVKDGSYCEWLISRLQG